VASRQRAECAASIWVIGGTRSRHAGVTKEQRGKTAPRRQIRKARRHSRDRFETPPAHAALQGRSQQPTRVGVSRGAQNCADRTMFDDPSGVHHRQAVGDFGRDPDIMRDKNHRHAEFALQLAEQ